MTGHRLEGAHGTLLEAALQAAVPSALTVVRVRPLADVLRHELSLSANLTFVPRTPDAVMVTSPHTSPVLPPSHLHKRDRPKRNRPKRDRPSE